MVRVEKVYHIRGCLSIGNFFIFFSECIDKTKKGCYNQVSTRKF